MTPHPLFSNMHFFLRCLKGVWKTFGLGQLLKCSNCMRRMTNFSAVILHAQYIPELQSALPGCCY